MGKTSASFRAGIIAEMVSHVLKKNHLFCSVERMNIADNENRSNRLAARAMIVTMRSPMMRKEAIIQLKRWLAKEGIMRGVTVCDSFSPDMQTTVRAMGRYADQQKKEGHLHQYRVINKDGAALLQVKEKRGDNYRDKLVSDQQLASFQRAPERSTPMEQDARQTREVREANRQQPPQQQQVQLEQRRRATGSNVEPVGAQQQQQSSSNKLPSSAGRQQTSSGQQQDIRPSIPQPGAMGPLPADQRGQDDYYLNLATIAQRQAAEALQLMGDEQRQQFQMVQQQGAEMQRSFLAAREALARRVELVHPCPRARLSLAMDASADHVGAVLQQRPSPAASWQPLGFFSQKLSTAQVNYSAFDRELLACVEAIRHFRYMLEGRQFTLFTDHKPLTFALHKVSDPWTQNFLWS